MVKGGMANVWHVTKLFYNEQQTKHIRNFSEVKLWSSSTNDTD